MKTLTEVQSICSQCKEILNAQYEETSGKVYFKKTCPVHGETKVLIANDADDYKSWTSKPVVNIAPKQAQTQGEKDNCPLNCGTCSEHLQTACCVLIDVTNRCNQHCPYCFAVAGDESEIREPSLEEISKKYDHLIELGEEWPFNIQLSGGEPTVRDDLPEIISMAREKGFNYIQINSNGKRIAQEDDYAKKLKKAGASVIFMQFDGMDDDIYMKMRNEPLLEIKKKAVENCRKAGLPVTLVPTVVKGVNLDDIGEMVKYMMDNVDVVKGIHFQPVSFFGRHPQDGRDCKGDFDGRVTMFDVMHEIEKQTDFAKYEDFCPISSGHTLCCFYSTYLKKGDSAKCLVSEKVKQEGASCCDTKVDSSSCCCGQDPLEIIKKDRNYVLNKWEVPECGCDAGEKSAGCCSDSNEETSCCCGDKNNVENGSSCCDEEEGPIDMDEFLDYYRANTFTLTGMAFMDGNCLDAERLKRCRVQQLTEDGRLIPFCAYNSIYRGEIC